MLDVAVDGLGPMESTPSVMNSRVDICDGCPQGMLKVQDHLGDADPVEDAVDVMEDGDVVLCASG